MATVRRRRLAARLLDTDPGLALPGLATTQTLGGSRYARAIHSA